MLLLWLIALSAYGQTYSDQFISYKAIVTPKSSEEIYLLAVYTPLTPEPREYLKGLVSPRLFDLLDRIIICESNYIATAANPNSSAKGIFQFISSTWDSWGEGDVLNAYDNIRAGVKLFKAKGVQPWLASKDCWK